MYAARGGAYRSLQQGPGAILPYGDCLLLVALQDALRELSAQAFIRHDAAEIIAATAQQEFLAHLVRLAPFLPSICLSGQLLLYRYRQQRWLLVLQRVQGAVVSPSPQRKSPLYPIIRSMSASRENLQHANRVDIAVGYLRKQRRTECLPLHSGRADAGAKATPKYNLKSLLALGESSSGHAGPDARAAGGGALQRRLPVKSDEGEDGTDEVADPPGRRGGASGAEVTASGTADDGRGDASAPPVLEGVSYFKHDGPLRASMPSIHAQQVTALIAAALEASKKSLLLARSARPPGREPRSAQTTRFPGNG